MSNSDVLIIQPKPSLEFPVIPVLVHFHSVFKKDINFAEELAALGATVSISSNENSLANITTELNDTLNEMRSSFKNIIIIEILKVSIQRTEGRFLLYLGNDKVLHPELKENIKAMYATLDNGAGFVQAPDSLAKESAVARMCQPSNGINGLQISPLPESKISDDEIRSDLGEIAIVCSGFLGKMNF